MKLVEGLWLPDNDEHFESQLKESPRFWGLPTYQFNKFQAIFPHLRGFRHAVDIGAHCGLWSRVLGRIFMAVTAFEPMPAHVECLALNAPDADVKAVALGKEPGTIRMNTGGDNSGNAAVHPTGEIEVSMRTLDSYNLQDVDFIKIDCEGYEINVVQGGLETIKRCKPAIIVEQHKGWAKAQGVYQFGALSLLKDMGMKEVARFNSDYLLTF